MSRRRQAAPLQALLLLIASLTGCGGPPINIQPYGPPRAAHAPAAVEVIHSVKALPAGFFYVEDPSGEKARLHAVADHPTAEDPHRVLALLALGKRSLAPLDDERAAALKAQAAKLGANRLLLPSPRLAYGYALWISEATPAPPTSAPLTAPAGWQAEGEAQRRDLAESAVTLSGVAGRCYRLQGALAPEARWRPEASRGVVIRRGGKALLVRQRLGAAEGFPLVAPTGGRYVKLRRFEQPLGCLKADTTWQISVTDRRGAPPGDGEITLQILSREAP